MWSYWGINFSSYLISLNNSNKINLTAYVSIEEIEIEGHKILHSFIPESSQVFKVIIPLATQNISDHDTMQATMQADEDTKKLLEFCAIPRRVEVKYRDL